MPTLESGKAETGRSPHVLEASLDYIVMTVSKRIGERKGSEGKRKASEKSTIKKCAVGSRWAPKGRLGVGAHPEESSFSLESNEAPQKNLEYICVLVAFTEEAEFPVNCCLTGNLERELTEHHRI